MKRRRLVIAGLLIFIVSCASLAWHFGFLSILGGPERAGTGHAFNLEMLTAEDREDAKTLFGKWSYQGLFGDSFELKANGKKRIHGMEFEWTVNNGRLVEYDIFGQPTESSFTLSANGTILTINSGRNKGHTYKREP